MLQDLRSIQIIKTVAQLGTVSGAARALGISQPALTKKIQAIENAVSLKLFRRDAKGTTLTSHGEFFLEQGEKLLLQAQDLTNRLQAFRQGDDGEIRIGLKTGLDDVFFTQVLLKLIQDCPRAVIEVDLDTTPSLVERVQAGELDLVLVARGYLDKRGRDSVLNPNIHFVDLCGLTLTLVVREGHPVLQTDAPLEHLFDYPLACPRAPTDILTLVASAQSQLNAPFPCPNMLIDDYGAVFKIIEASDHWTAVPTASAPALKRLGTLHLIPDGGLLPPLRIGYATRTLWDPIPSATRLIELVEAAVAALPDAVLAPPLRLFT